MNVVPLSYTTSEKTITSQKKQKMSKYNLPFISDNDLYKHVLETVEKYSFKMDLKKFNSNLIAPMNRLFMILVVKCAFVVGGTMGRGSYNNFTALFLLAAIFRLTTSKDDIDGSEVNDVYYKENDLNRIAIYCTKDVILTGQLFLRMQNLPIIKEENIIIVE